MRFELAGGTDPGFVLVFVENQLPQFVSCGAEWIAPPDLPGAHVVFATTDGFWDVVATTETVRAAGRVTVHFPRLPATGPFGWWHLMLGITDRSLTRGSDICIGVIDEGLSRQASYKKSCISHVINDGAAAWGSASDPRANSPKSDHGDKVCSLIASRASGARGFSGIAPGAEVIFASAYSPHSERGALWTPYVGDCIQYLAEQRQCDVLSISAGDLDEPSPAIETAVQRAADVGTVCFFAAGNSGAPKYPALQADCHGVAAIGRFGTAPSETRIEWVEHQQSIPLGVPDLYVWTYSARGPQIEFCAPGVGVIFSRMKRAAGALVGTSFACPIAAAAAALILEKSPDYVTMDRNRDRYNRAMQILRSTARSVGAPIGQFWRHGLLRL